VCLLFYAPIPMGILVAGCILELVRIWQPHCQDKQHIHIETYIRSNGDHTFNYIYQSNITQSFHRFDHKAYVSCNYYTKNNCYLLKDYSLKRNSPFGLMIFDTMNATCLPLLCSRPEPVALIKVFW
jgi:hypothetical protein